MELFTHLGWLKTILFGGVMAILLLIFVRRYAKSAFGTIGLIAAGLLISVVMNLWLPSGIVSYLSTFILVASIYGMLSLGLNVQWGSTGLFNIGIAAFFAIGAFTSALVTTKMPEGALAAFVKQAFGLGQPFVIGVIAAGLVSAILGWLVAKPTLHLRGDYLAIATIGIAELIRLIFANEQWLANGPQPLRGIPQPLSCLATADGCGFLPGFINNWFAPLTPRDYPFLYLFIVMAILYLVFLALERMLKSPWGRVLRAVREQEDAANMVGKDVAAFRVQAFVVGSAIMGIGGALYAHYIISIDASHFDPLHGTFLVWAMLMLGGSGNNRGAILGALLVYGIWSGASFLVDSIRPALALISDQLPQRGPYIRLLLISILLIVTVLYRPAGLIPEEKSVSSE